jgi:hypothetical protein
MRINYLILPILLLCECAVLKAQNTGSVSDAQVLLNRRLLLAGSNEVSRVEVICIPEEVHTFEAVTPKYLEDGYWSKTIIRQFRDSKFRENLLQAIKQSSIKIRSGAPSDLRWGCIMYDDRGARLLSIYFDKFGKGSIDELKVSSNGKLLQVLRPLLVR